MNEQPINNHRPDARATVRVLTAGTLAAVAVFAVAFGLRLAGQVGLADGVGTLGVVVLLATPAMALITTAYEMRDVQRNSAWLALVVLTILVGATVVALIVLG